jgi:hypothetical protein
MSDAGLLSISIYLAQIAIGGSTTIAAIVARIFEWRRSNYL